MARVLNLSDCHSYGVAVDRGAPLLYKGEDFRATPIAAAPYRHWRAILHRLSTDA